jgi:hypothetical protein
MESVSLILGPSLALAAMPKAFIRECTPIKNWAPNVIFPVAGVEDIARLTRNGG